MFCSRSVLAWFSQFTARDKVQVLSIPQRSTCRSLVAYFTSTHPTAGGKMQGLPIPLQFTYKSIQSLISCLASSLQGAWYRSYQYTNTMGGTRLKSKPWNVKKKSHSKCISKPLLLLSEIWSESWNLALAWKVLPMQYLDLPTDPFRSLLHVQPLHCRVQDISVTSTSIIHLYIRSAGHFTLSHLTAGDKAQALSMPQTFTFQSIQLFSLIFFSNTKPLNCMGQDTKTTRCQSLTNSIHLLSHLFSYYPGKASPLIPFQNGTSG